MPNKKRSAIPKGGQRSVRALGKSVGKKSPKGKKSGKSNQKPKPRNVSSLREKKEELDEQLMEEDMLRSEERVNNMGLANIFSKASMILLPAFVVLWLGSYITYAVTGNLCWMKISKFMKDDFEIFVWIFIGLRSYGSQLSLVREIAKVFQK